MIKNIQGVIFDMDGVLVDSEEFRNEEDRAPARYARGRAPVSGAVSRCLLSVMPVGYALSHLDELLKA